MPGPAVLSSTGGGPGVSTSEEIDQRTRELFATAAEIKDLFFNYSPLYIKVRILIHG